MKKLLFAIAFMTAGSVAVLAQEATPTTEPSTEIAQDQDQDKQEIATSDLPANIQASLQGQDYSGWTVSKAFKKEKDGVTTYTVELSQGTEKTMVSFDADGNKIMDEEKKDKE
jgi:hypothetical protein